MRSQRGESLLCRALVSPLNSSKRYSVNSRSGRRYELLNDGFDGWDGFYGYCNCIPRRGTNTARCVGPEPRSDKGTAVS